MKAFYLVVISILIFIAGCGETYQITKKNVGPNGSETIYTSSKIKIMGNNTSDYDVVYLQYYCSKSDSGLYYSFIIETIGTQWLDIQRLELDIDGMETQHDYDNRPVVDARDVRGINETANFPLNKNKIIDIIELRECKIKIVGDARTIEIRMAKDAIDKLDQFYVETAGEL